MPAARGVPRGADGNQLADDDRHELPASSIDRAIRLSTAAAVLAVAAIAAYVSYWHAYAVVRAHGETGIAAGEPATIDGLVYASSMLVCTRHGTGYRAIPGPPATRSRDRGDPHGEYGPGRSPGPVGAVVAAWPAVSLVVSYELLVWLIRTSGAVESGPSADPPVMVRPAVLRSFPRTSAVDGDRAGGSGRDVSGPARRSEGQAAGQSAIPASGQRDDEVPKASAINDAAVAAYMLSVQAGNSLSERRVAQMFDVHPAAGRERESRMPGKHHRSETRRASRSRLNWRRWRANSEP